MPWLVVDVQWSPFAARDYWVVSTANHRALVWNLNLREDSPSGAIEHSLQGHSRAITDVNFSAHHPDFLATCAVDGYVHCWDLRRPRQPVLSFCDWVSGATQVKYNRQDPHILASSHDRNLHIWDDRRGCEPVKSICAHASKIYGLDWNRTRANGVVTCSLDKSIKFWDSADESKSPERVIRTDFPVWRARHTPFGCGILAMPQNEPGNLYLYHRHPQGTRQDGKVQPSYVFNGHGNNKVKEFLWRSRGGVGDDRIDDREFQLVSWGEDNELRLQHLESNVEQSIGYARGATARRNLVLTRKGATYKTFRAVDDGGHWDKRAPTMSDPRPGTSGKKYHESALTLGMRSTPPNRNRITTPWRGPSMTAKRTTTKDLDGSLAQIGWMKGVTMTKRKSSSEGARSTRRRMSSKESNGIFSPGYADDEWDEPETIEEEFIRIGQKFPKVKWNAINLDAGIFEASLDGPWGENGDSVYFKVRVEIPSNYPKAKSPKFAIEKASMMPDVMHKKIEREIHELAARFLERKQNCLDMAFTYLLGDVDLESSSSYFKNDIKAFDDDLDGLADESSSDEDDDDIPAGGSASMSQELTNSTGPDNQLAPISRVAIPPLPRLCGARFSSDGQLVCFFPTKEEQAKALFASPEAVKERPKGEPFFPGFGRIVQDSPLRRRYVNEDTSTTDEQSGESDEEDESSNSSSDSESLAMHQTSLWYTPGRPLRRAWSENRSIRSSGGGTGVGTGTGTGTSKRRSGRPRNIISIYDLRKDLPSKKEFARDYLIFGDGADVCTHNAEVAERYGYTDLVHIWRYAAMLLRKGIPLELVGRQRRDSILVIARDVAARFHGLDASSESSSPPDEHDIGLAGRVKWGTHPLAVDFVANLFDYFEKIADIQMLAMLSCIFSDSSAEDSVAYIESHLTQPETPLPLKAPSFSLDYFPTEASQWTATHGRSQNNSAVTTPRTAHTPVHFSGSQNSDNDALWAGDPGSNSYSCGETPPPKSTKEYMVEIDQPHSLSTSPNSRVFKRSNSALAASLVANFPRSLGGSVSSSPPSQGRKKPSPSEIILGSLAPASIPSIPWGPSMILGDSGGTGRTSVSDEDRKKDELLPLVPVSVSVSMMDQSIFDDDGWMSVPLLEPSRSALYANYRYAYAEMLQMWGEPLARLEVMKFTLLKEEMASGTTVTDSFSESFTIPENGSGAAHTLAAPSSPILLGKREQLQALVSSGRGLDVTGMCHIHELQLEPTRYTSSATSPPVGGAVGRCERCNNNLVQAQLRCVYCLEPIDALYPPCLSCGCASHDSCLAEWHATGEVYCPAGDDCNCVEEASNGQVESWVALLGAIERGRRAGGSGKGLLGAMIPPSDTRGSEADDDEEKHGWESIGKESIPSKLGLTSPAKMSLGNRLKKSAGDWGRGGTRRNAEVKKKG